MTVEEGAAPVPACNDEDIIAWFDGIAENAGLVQTETLRRIVERNLGTEYLRKCLGTELNIRGMDAAAIESLFASSVPLVSHADLEPYIQRIADGDTSTILTQNPINTLSLSSGTTEGRPKYVPFTRFSSQSTLQICRLAAAYRSRVFPIRAGGKALEFIYSGKLFETKGGLTAGTATSHVFASEEFKTKQKATQCFCCSPLDVISGGDYKQSTYCHLLLGLVFSDEVELITSTFAYSVVQALAALEDRWEDICGDIRHGTLSGRVTSPKMRRAVLELNRPNPSLAARIESECAELRRFDWRRVIPRLWPKAKYVCAIMTGSMQPYLKKLRHFAGEVPLVCADYGSTESWIGVNVEPRAAPERATFTLVPSFAYFEFIPLYRKEREQNGCHVACDDFVEGQPLQLSQVKLGQQYELVLTTYTGLYRYRLGDVVEVSGFYKGTPQLAFVCRRKLILSVNIDKNTEKDLQLAVEKGSRLFYHHTKAEIVDFCSHAVSAGNHRTGHYIIYWEVKGDVGDDRVLEWCCREMDEAFVDYGYVVSRRTGSIGPLELRIVEPGTFGKILEYYIGNGSAMSQFKTPRCTSNQVLLRILDRCTVKRFWSTAYDAGA